MRFIGVTHLANEMRAERMSITYRWWLWEPRGWMIALFSSILTMDGVLVSSSSISPRPQMKTMTAQNTAPADLGGHTVCARKNGFVCQRALELWVVACQHSLTQLIHLQWVRLTECSAETNSIMGVFIRNVQKYRHEKSHLLRARDFYQQLNVYLTHAKSWVWSTVP